MGRHMRFTMRALFIVVALAALVMGIAQDAYVRISGAPLKRYIVFMQACIESHKRAWRYCEAKAAQSAPYDVAARKRELRKNYPTSMSPIDSWASEARAHELHCRDYERELALSMEKKRQADRLRLFP
jgi:hypothetical protein